MKLGASHSSLTIREGNVQIDPWKNIPRLENILKLFEISNKKIQNFQPLNENV